MPAVLKIATWNVNSIKVRLGHVLDYLRSATPDVLLLQETKVPEDQFPRLEIEALGYRAAAIGQRGYNGAAILSKLPMSDVARGLPGFEDEQARYIEATIADLRIASLYLPNGNPIDSDKFTYKLDWMRAFRNHVRSLLALDQAFVLGGDYNVAPEDIDVFDPATMAEDAVCRPEARALFREVIYLGVTEAFRTLHPDLTQAYSYYDYQAGAWEKGRGIRIDHLLLSPTVADRLVQVGIDRAQRGLKQPSDHVPVWCELEGV
ncbi:MAG: exodeoxyribonuclease III [Alphaproteobacteria bacterium]|nr:exodeoxyribonuclease III [Alphaproteobacteria bacterium]